MPALVTSLYNNGYGKAQEKQDVAITTTIGGQDAFIVRYDTNGTALWSARIGGTGSEIAWAVTTDSYNNVIACGQTGSATKMVLYNADGSGTGKIIQNNGSNDAFICKYHSSGKASWIARIGAAGTDIAYSISTDSIGNIYVAGQQANNICVAYNADGTAFGTSLPSRGGTESFLIKYDPNGTVLWVSQIAGTGNDIGFGLDINKSTGDAYVVGQTSSTASVTTAYNSDGTAFATTLPAVTTTSDAFIAKYDTSGFVQWITRVVSPGTDNARAVAIDSSGDIYVHCLTSALTTQTTIAYNSDGTAFATQPAGLATTTGARGDSVIVKYNSSGFVQWVTLTSNANIDTVYSIAVDSSSNVYISQNLSGSGNGDIFLKKLNPSTGALVWTVRIDSDGGDNAWGITTDSSGNVYIGISAGTNIGPYTIRVRNTAGTAVFTVTALTATVSSISVSYTHLTLPTKRIV